jgi:hypothetical protein
MADDIVICNWCGKEADPEYDVREMLTHTHPTARVIRFTLRLQGLARV